MTDRLPETFTAAEASSPQTDATTLAHIANVRPDLHAAILANPNVYPELASWIHQRGTITPQQPSVQQPAQQQPTQQQQSFVQPAQPNFSQQQYGQPQYGQPGYPAQSPAAANFQQALGQFQQNPTGFITHNWPPLSAIVAALLGFISLFLPAVSASYSLFGASASFSASFIQGDGVFLLPLYLLTIAASVLIFALRAPWVSTAFGVSTLVTGASSLIVAVVAISRIGSYSGYGVSIGAGTVLVLLTGIILIGIGIAHFLLRSKRR